MKGTLGIKIIFTTCFTSMPLKQLSIFVSKQTKYTTSWFKSSLQGTLKGQMSQSDQYNVTIIQIDGGGGYTIRFRILAYRTQYQTGENITTLELLLCPLIHKIQSNR